MNTYSLAHPPVPVQFYDWQGDRAAYEVRQPATDPQGPPLLLIHPIGVGLSRQFWWRFCDAWHQAGHRQTIYNPDLLGCGDSAMPARPYQPQDWAAQLAHFLQTVVQQPVVLVVQGALFPVAVELVQQVPDLVRGLVLSGPPAWRLMTTDAPHWRHQLNWTLLEWVLGVPFFLYARRSRFLQSFSERQLFAQAADIDATWLAMLQGGAEKLASRHAVYAFLAGFWRHDWRAKIAQIHQPTLVLMGDAASAITREVKAETATQKLQHYLDALPHSEGQTMPGRNVLPYESTAEFVAAIAPFLTALTTTNQ